MNLSCCLCTDTHTLQTTKQVYRNIKTFGFYPNWGVLWCFCFGLVFFPFLFSDYPFQRKPEFQCFHHNNSIFKPPYLKIFTWSALETCIFLVYISLQCHNFQDLCAKTPPFRSLSWVRFFPYLILSKSIIFYNTLWVHTYSTIQYAPQPFGPKSFTDGKDPE